MTRSTGGAIAAFACLLLAAQAQAQTLTPPTYTAEQAARGKEIFTTNCVSCHGAHLDDGEFGPPLAGPAFLAQWSGQALDGPFTFMSTQMPPSNPGGLEPKNYADVLSYILSENGVAPSATPLPPDANILKGWDLPKK